MSDEAGERKEADNNTKDDCSVLEDDCIITDDCVLSKSTSAIIATPPQKSLNNTSFNSKRKLTSTEKIDKNLKLQIKLENAKKRQEEKEKKEKEKKEREEARLKREEEIRKKKEEEEQLRLKKAEELRKKKEEEEQLKLKKAEELRKKKEEEEQLKLKKAEELRMKEEERLKKKEEERLKKEERLEKERKRQEMIKKKEEEKQREEEEKKRKAEKDKQQFLSFFIKKDNPQSNDKDEQRTYRFMPFQPKENMTVAPISRRIDFVNMTCEKKLEFLKNIDQSIDMNNENKDSLAINYLKEIKENTIFIKKQKNRRTKSTDSIKEIIDLNKMLTAKHTIYKVKYLHFDLKTNKRPPYYGTWRQKSKIIKPRTPFAKDEKLLNYEIDSDDEWEDEPEGESIVDSGEEDGGADEEVVDDEDDDGFFVPHGHLSDDELDEEERTLDPEIKKARELAKKEQWEMGQKKKSKILTQKSYINLNYWSDDVTSVDTDSSDFKLLERLKMVPLGNNFPISITNETLNRENSKVTSQDNEGTSTPKTKNTKTSNLNNVNESSPSSASKPTKSHKKINLQQATLQTTPTSNTTVTSDQPSAKTTATTTAQSTNNTPSIINFISKMSKKSVVCKSEQPNATADKSEIVSVNTDAKSSAVSAVCAKQSSNLTSSLSTSSLTASSKIVLNTITAAEKRVCSSNDDNSVKRLKLDQNPKEEKNNSEDCNEPKVLTLSVTSIVKNGSSKKFLKLGDPAVIKPVPASPAVPVSTKTASATDLATPSDLNLKNNKENQQQEPVLYITIDE